MLRNYDLAFMNSVIASLNTAQGTRYNNLYIQYKAAKLTENIYNE